jgi:hypothetical protein
MTMIDGVTARAARPSLAERNVVEIEFQFES